MSFIRAEQGPPVIGDPPGKYTVQYFDEKGNMTMRIGGTRAWRNNNPGNLVKSSYSMSKKRGAIGKSGDSEHTYPIYPDYETGHQALVVMLRGSVYSPLTLRAAMKRFDSSQPKYIDTIVSITGLSPDRTIKSLSDAEFEQFWEAIEHTERWDVGTEDFFECWLISGVHKKRGVIYEYLVRKGDQPTWIAKAEAIALAEQHCLHATIVHLRNGTVYLRPEQGKSKFQRVA